MSEMIHPVTYAGLRNGDYTATLESIYKAIEVSFGVSKEQVLSKRRHRDTIWGRIAFAQLVRFGQKKGVVEVAKVMGVDHATVSHYGKRHLAMMRFDADYRNMFLQAESKLTHLSVGRRPLIADVQNTSKLYFEAFLRELFTLDELRDIVIKSLCEGFDVTEGYLLNNPSNLAARLRGHSYLYLRGIGINALECGKIFGRSRARVNDSVCYFREKLEHDFDARVLNNEVSGVLSRSFIDARKSLTFVGL